jgi:glycosyltransferase involved in cell wall biosynthesis
MDQGNVMVSIGMPVYNDKAFLGAALDSLINQTFTGFELIISDDCSTDGSQDLCLQYAEKDRRIRYVRQPHNIGISKNMEFLLKEAKGTYFMWAGNDDLWHPDYIARLLAALKKNSGAVVSFPNVSEIDEAGKLLRKHDARLIDYSGREPAVRIKKLVRTFYDGFGYGLFVRDKITGVRFPVWWWINRTCAYNNIYPTLCFYLTRGDYVQEGDEPLWFNRIKNQGNINHKVPFNNSFLRGYFAFLLRKINLIVYSQRAIRNAGGSYGLLLQVFFPMWIRWFFIPAFHELRHWTKRLLKREIRFW